MRAASATRGLSPSGPLSVRHRSDREPESYPGEHGEGSEHRGGESMPSLPFDRGAPRPLETEGDCKASEHDRRAQKEGDHADDAEDAARKPDPGRTIARAVGAPGPATEQRKERGRHDD